MRVKPAIVPADGEDSDAASDHTATTSTSMGKSSTTTLTYPQPTTYPSFFDLLDSPDADEEETDSPIPADFEEDLLDMLSSNMYPPPPYQAPNGYGNQYGGYGNQYMQGYAPYGNYGGGYGSQQMVQAPQQTGGQQSGQLAQTQKVQIPVSGAVTKQSQNINSAGQANISAGQANISTGQANMNAHLDVYSQGEQLMQDLQTVVDQKPIILDPIHTIVNVKKIGNGGDGGDTSSNQSEESDSSKTMNSTYMNRQSFSSESSPGPIASTSAASTSTKKTTTTMALPTKQRKVSAAAISPKSRSKNPPLAITVDVPEEVLYEEAKSKPIKHRKEPDIVESKDRSVRNAINARVNRQKHRLYVDKLEQEVDDLKNENQGLENKYQNSLSKIEEMQLHIKYLENVIANDLSISNIINKLGTVENVKLSSSISRKRKLTTNSDEAMDLSEPALKVSAGVCLHVDQNNVSIEFCEQCAKRATDNMKNGTT